MMKSLREGCLPKGILVEKVQLVHCNHRGKPAWAQNDAMMEAYIDGMDFGYRINDDTLLKTPYYLQFHENGQSPYGFDIDISQVFWFNSGKALKLHFGQQINTIRVNKSNYTCNEDNSNHFMECLENYYSKKLGCILPKTVKTG